VKLLTNADTHLATLLDHPADEVRIDPGWWSFSGAHGGLSVALLAGAMRRAVGADIPLRSVSAQFLRPVDGPMRRDAEVLKQGRSLAVASSTGRVEGRPHLVASAVFGRPGRGPAVPSPAMPWSPPIEETDRLEMPTLTLPFFAHTEIRPLGDTRPFAGGDRAELVAWVRLVDDDQPVDELRLVVLFDCLAPALSAVMPTMAAIPTIELGVHLTPAVRTATSPWILLRARTELAGEDGWCSEQLEAWGPDGRFYGTATQLRLTLG
jgi:acyl-CoA thioesterase